MELTEEELDGVYDMVCDIEVDELFKAGEDDLSERGETASDIVTLFGNALAKAEGYYDEVDEEND